MKRNKVFQGQPHDCKLIKILPTIPVLGAIWGNSYPKTTIEIQSHQFHWPIDHMEDGNEKNILVLWESFFYFGNHYSTGKSRYLNIYLPVLVRITFSSVTALLLTLCYLLVQCIMLYSFLFGLASFNWVLLR